MKRLQLPSMRGNFRVNDCGDLVVTKNSKIMLVIPGAHARTLRDWLVESYPEPLPLGDSVGGVAVEER